MAIPLASEGAFRGPVKRDGDAFGGMDLHPARVGIVLKSF